MTLETVNTGDTGQPIVVDRIDGKNVQAAKILLGAQNTDGAFLGPDNPMPIGAPPSIPLPPGAATDAKLDELIAALAGKATEAALAAISAKLPALLTGIPENDISAPPTRLVGQDVWNCSFSNVGTTIAPELTTPIQGTGVSFAQASGTLTITAGTTANAEFLTRSVRTWEGAMRARLSSVMGARSANNNFTWMLADLVGEGLAYNIVNATTVDVTLPAHGFTSANVGQRMFLGGITTATGSAPRIPGRYSIASIPDANTIRFTVAGGWASSGTGTLTLFGHSYARVAFEGATATTTTYGTGRRGWTGTPDTAAASNLTTAAPGVIHTIELTGREAFFFDHLRASATAPTIAVRASRYEDLPDDNLPLYLWIWSYNGTTGPASTTWAISFASIEKYANLPVYVQGQRAQGAVNPAPVAQQGTATVAGTVTANLAGQTAHDTAITGNPARIGARALAAHYTAVAGGDAADMVTDLNGRLVVALGGIPQLQDRNRVALSSATETTLIAAVASVRHGITRLVLANHSATNAVRIDVRDTTAGTIRDSYQIPAGQTVVVSCPDGDWQAAVNTNWTVQATGTTPDVSVSARSFRVGY
jgi:hypothetical protein